MPKATFEDFLSENPMYQSLADNRDARRVFDILNENENIFSAVKFSQLGKPALMANVEEIETYIDNLGENSTFDLEVNFNRMGVGRMVKNILAPFGYAPIPDSQKSFKAKHFRTASCYKFSADSATMFLEVSAHEN